jgi:hypothetical protein
MHFTVSFDKSLLGCDALALDSGDTIWAATMVANDNPVVERLDSVAAYGV